MAGLALVATSTLAPHAADPAAATPPRAAAQTGSSPCEAGFSDVDPDSSFAEAIEWMACEGLTQGYSDGTFGVKADITREESAAFLFRVAAPDYAAPIASPFPDVPAVSGPFYAPVTWMHDEGMARGYADGQFKPDRSITRGEMAKILYGTADPDYPTPDEAPFSDVPRGSTYHRYVSWMKSVGATQGYADGTFRPDQPITRGEMAKLLWVTARYVDRNTAAAPAQFTALGAGWGHGVGMSQYGARTLADRGYSAQQILRYYYSPAEVRDTVHRADANIKVHLHSAATSSLDATRTDGTNAKLRVRSGSTVLETDGAVTLRVDGDQVVAAVPGGAVAKASSMVVEWPGTRFWAGQASTLRVPDANAGTAPLDLRHGKVIVTVVGGRLNLVTELRMVDEYLYGLSEVASSWRPPALQAQAVAGRSYALRNMAAEKTSCGCHVWDEVRSQKFTGWAKENEQWSGTHWGRRWTDAVDATLTRGADERPVSALSLWYGSSVADATYFSSSGGHTRNAEDVWSSAVPYLTARPDPYSVDEQSGNPYRSWTSTVAQRDLQDAFGLRDVVGVSLSRDQDLTPAALLATARDGSTSRITGKRFRQDVALRSAWVWSIVPR